MLWTRFVRMRWRRQVVVVFAAAFLIRFTYVCVIGRLTSLPELRHEQVSVARHLLHGQGFTSPIGPERDDPSSWYVPGYIATIAAAFWALGEHTPASFVALRVFNLLTHALALALWVAVGRYLLGRRVAAISALLMVFSPVISYKATEIWDTFPTMLGGALCFAVLIRYRLVGGWSHFLAGGLCGMVTMINPCFSACYPIWVLANWWRQRDGSVWRARLLLRPAWVIIGFGLAILPWSVRNRVVFGEWFYLRGNLGFEMWLGNAPWSDGYFYSVNGERRHPVFNPAEGQRIVRVGEAQYIKDCTEELIGWLRDDPSRIAGLVLRRVKWFWFGRFDERLTWSACALKFLGFTVPGMLALAGAIHLLARRPFCWVLVATLVVFPIPYYLSIMMVRYRLPIEPLLLLVAASFLSSALRARTTTCRAVRGRPRVGSPTG